METLMADQVLAELQPEEEAQRALAKLAVQRSLRFNFSEQQHITCASPPVPGRTWSGKIRKMLHQQFGDTQGFCDGDLETEAVMLDVDEIIYGKIPEAV